MNPLRTLCVAVALVAWTATGTPAPVGNAGPDVPGSWDIEKGPWRIGPDGLRLNAPAKVRSDYAVRREQPIPTGDWTLELWALKTAGLVLSGDPVWLTMGEPGSRDCFRMTMQPSVERMTVQIWHGNRIAAIGECPWAAGPIVAVRLACSANEGRMALWVNGIPSRGSARSFAIPAPSGALRLGVSGEYATYEPYAVHISRLVFADGARLADPHPPGPAFKGFQRAPTSPVADADRRRLAALLSQASDRRSSAHGLAAHVLASFSPSGGIPDSLWRRALPVCKEAGELDGRSLLLAVCAACGSSRQRAELVPVRDRFIAELLGADRSDVRAEWIVTRSAMLDPVGAAEWVANHGAVPSVIHAMQPAVHAASPASELGMLTRKLSAYSWRDHHAAWLLPDLRRASRDYAALTVERLSLLGGRRTNQSPDPARARSFAAYRLAPTDPDAAILLAEGIEDDTVRADTFDLIAPHLPQAVRARLRAQIEPLMLQGLREWTPGRGQGSRTSAYCRVARWYASIGDLGKASHTLGEAARLLDQEPELSFNDLWALTQAMLTAGHPDAQRRLDQAIRLAPAWDAKQPEIGGANVYVGACTVLAGWLARNGRTDQALKLARSLAGTPHATAHALGLNYVFASVIRKDPARAHAIWKETPPCPLRDGMAAKLAERLAASRPDQAFTLAMSIRPEARAFTLLALAARMPSGASAARVRKLVAAQLPKSLSALLAEQKRTTDRSAWSRLRMSLAALPLADLIGLRPAFSGSPGMFYEVLPAWVANRRGLSSDPLWKGIAPVLDSSLDVEFYDRERLRDVLEGEQWRDRQRDRR